MIRRLLLAAALLNAIGVPASWAVEPSERLADPGLEARARVISQELRCLVCQNESIDESNAQLAHDLRLLVRRRLVAGDTDQQVLNYIVARYGAFVLLNPPFEPVTWLLWLGPPALVLGAGAILLLRLPAAAIVAPFPASQPPLRASGRVLPAKRPSSYRPVLRGCSRPPWSWAVQSSLVWERHEWIRRRSGGAH